MVSDPEHEYHLRRIAEIRQREISSGQYGMRRNVKMARRRGYASRAYHVARGA